MIRQELQAILKTNIDALVARGELPYVSFPTPEVSDPRDPSHGDYACNFALICSKLFGKSPRDLAEILRTSLLLSSPEVFASIEVAGPGFLNLRLVPAFTSAFLALVVPGFEKSSAAKPLKINVEFVSVNPNGPITIGSGRGAAYGSTLCNVLAAAGHTVHREYYINDGVNSEQMRLFAESVRAAALGTQPPESGYKGDYVKSVADKLLTNDSSLLDFQLQTALKAFGTISELSSDPTRRGYVKGFLLSELQKNQAILKRISGDEPAVQLPAGFFDLPEEERKAIFAELHPRKAPEDEIRDMNVAMLQHISQDLMLTSQNADLQAFGVVFDTWFSEQSLHDGGQVAHEIEALEAKGAADTRPIRHKLKLAKGRVIEDVEIEPQDESGTSQDEGDPEPSPPSPLSPGGARGSTLWLRATKFGDDMDRVLRRKDGRLTYIASDIAYHKDKFNRPEGADKLITILGPDHHGYIARLHAVLAAIEFPSLAIAGEGAGGGVPGDSESLTSHGLSEVEAKLYAFVAERDAARAALEKAKQELEVVIFQLVRFVKDGKPAPMRKRDGNIYAIIDLIKEIGQHAKPSGTTEEQLKIGKDVARFFYLMRSHDTTFDFDLDLAQRQSDENPVFYVQYAHARICSVLRKAEEAGIESNKNYDLLQHDRELALIRKICDLPEEVTRTAEDYGVHRLTTYAIELARTYHSFYDVCRVIEPGEPAISGARCALCEATKIALKAVFDLLGIEAPEKMERDPVALEV